MVKMATTIPKNGSISDCDYQLKRWSIEYLAYEYRLRNGYNKKTVYVDSYTELKEQIAEFLNECYSDTQL